MAGDWIKWVKGLTRKSEVLKMSTALNRTRHEVSALCMEIWEWADSETSDGHISGATAAFVDDLVACPGFFCALENVGWAQAKAGGITLNNWSRHNGESAKTRARNAINQAARRIPVACHRDVTKMSPTSGDKTVTREEKRREEVNTTHTEARASEPAVWGTDPPMPGFYAFWDAYPKHRRNDPTGCMRLWVNMALEPKSETIVSALEQHKASTKWAERGGEFIPKASKFLEELRWECEPINNAEVARYGGSGRSGRDAEQEAALRSLIATNAAGGRQ